MVATSICQGTPNLFKNKYNQCTNYNTTRKPEMKMIEFGRFIFWKQGSHQWITGCFNRSVCNTDQQGGKKKRPVAGCKNGQDDAGQVKNKGHFQQPFHADDIHNKTSDHDCQRKSPECCGSNGSQFGSIQVKFRSQFAQDTGPDTERKRGDK